MTSYPLVICCIAIEHCHLWLIYLAKIVIFNSYVGLPEGKQKRGYRFSQTTVCRGQKSTKHFGKIKQLDTERYMFHP
jgi:hypothetical protein